MKLITDSLTEQLLANGRAQRAAIHNEQPALDFKVFFVGRAVRFRDASLLLRCGRPAHPCPCVRRMRLTLPSPGTGELEA